MVSVCDTVQFFNYCKYREFENTNLLVAKITYPVKKSTYSTNECTAVNILQLTFNTILSLTEIFRVISVSKSSTVGLK